MKKKEIIQELFDSREEISYEEYCQWCYDVEREPQSEESKDYYDYVDNRLYFNWDDFKSNIYHSKVNNYPWLITGKLGLWRGNFDIEPTLEPTLLDAILSCVGRGDYELLVVRNNNTIEVCVIHHDGRNSFELHALSEDGAERFRKHGKVSLKRKENVVKLPEFLF